METNHTLPTWAPRLPQHKIARLYHLDAQGIYDEELIDEVGYGLLFRCQSFIEAVEATQGKVHCPRCSAIVTHGGGGGNKDELLQCACGWQLTWGEYFATLQHKQLSGAEAILEQFRSYVKAFPAAQTPPEKMFLIDQLIHGFHWYVKFGPTRPAAVNLIEGRLREVVAFLEKLTYGEGSTPGLAEQYTEWNRAIEFHSSWYRTKQNEPGE